MKKRPIGIWLVAIFGILLTLSMAQNTIEVLFGSPTGVSEYVSTGFLVASSVPLLIAAFVFFVLVIRLNRHAFWGWVAMVLAMVWPIVILVYKSGTDAVFSNQAYGDTAFLVIRYGPLLFWAAVLGLIGVYLYHARKVGILK